jgi:hypothetical protein
VSTSVDAPALVRARLEALALPMINPLGRHIPERMATRRDT